MTNSKSLVARIEDAIEQFPPIVKDSKNPHFKSTFASLGAIRAAIKPALKENGITYRYLVADTVLHLLVECAETGELIKHTAPLYGENAQQYGASLTYQRRYLLQAAFDLDVVDDDGEGAMGRGATADTNTNKPAPRAKRTW
jgi:ERF superfamily